MKKKNEFSLWLLIVLLSTTSQSEAQRLHVGIGGGITGNVLRTDTTSLSYTSYEPGRGFVIEVPVLYQVNKWFSIQAAPAYLQKNNKQERYGRYKGIYHTTINTYIQLPVMANFAVGRKLKGFTNIGGYGAYWAGSRVKGAMLNDYSVINDYTDNIVDQIEPTRYNEKYHFDSRKDNRFEWGWLFGLGASYQLNKSYRLYMEGRFYSSFTDQQKKYSLKQTPRYNNTLSLSVGCMYNIFNKW